MGLIAEILVSALIVVGSIFALVGSYGLVKLPELMARLHAPTKATTLGVGGILIASMVHFAVLGDFTIHELLITLFLLLTAPITANFIAKTYMHRHRDKVGAALPPPVAPCRDWATYAPPSEPASRIEARKD